MIGGIPFLCANEITVRPAKTQIVIGVALSSIHRVSRNLLKIMFDALRASSKSSVKWHGSYFEIDLPSEVEPDDVIAIEPKFGFNCRSLWPTPYIIGAVDGKIRLLNTIQSLIHIRKHKHVCQARYTTKSYRSTYDTDFQPVATRARKSGVLHSYSVCLDPDLI